MTVEILYPEVCNLYGDLMSCEYLRQSGAQIVETSLKEKPKFIDGGISLVYMAPMTERSQEIVIKALTPYKDDILSAIDRGQVFFVTGNALEIFGGSIENEDGSVIKCLGIYGTVAKRKMYDRYNAIYLGKMGDMDIVGYKSQFTHSYGCGELEPIFKTVRGHGRNPSFSGEGIKINNFYGTYLIGPMLVCNPPFMKYLMEKCGVENPKIAFEKKAMEVYRKRVAEFSDPKTRVIY